MNDVVCGMRHLNTAGLPLKTRELTILYYLLGFLLITLTLFFPGYKVVVLYEFKSFHCWNLVK